MTAASSLQAATHKFMHAPFAMELITTAYHYIYGHHLFKVSTLWLSNDFVFAVTYTAFSYMHTCSPQGVYTRMPVNKPYMDFLCSVHALARRPAMLTKTCSYCAAGDTVHLGYTLRKSCINDT